MKVSRTGILISALPSFLMVMLFYSLAIHMYYRLRGWPASIGNAGFPPSLVMHGEFTWKFFSFLFFVSAFILPAPLLLCLIVPRLRRFVVYFVFYALSYGVCWGLILLAPKPFLNWWAD